jgi:hypothetical protein
MRRFLAFDIETAKVLPDGIGDILVHRPLGIACATATANDISEPLIWHGKSESGRPSGQMTSIEATQVVSDLADLTSRGYTLVTWNGLGFDLDVLAEESGKTKECALLAVNHVDMLFHVLCSLGHLISLQRAAEGMHIVGKKAGFSGAVIPAMWAAGRYGEVIDYCIQDARLTLQLAEGCERSQQLSWITQRGGLGRMLLPSGWLTVREANALALPDTSWMSDPPSRDRALQWIRKVGLVP